jgi:hypothetical protein
MWYAPLGPMLLLASCGAAIAQDPQMLPGATVVGNQFETQTTDYIMQLGPYGALVWGAWALRGLMEALKGGIQISIVHKHEFTDAGIEAIERMTVTKRTRRSSSDSPDA